MSEFNSEKSATNVLEKKVSSRDLGDMSLNRQGSFHTFSEEEKEAFSEHINFCLSSDPDLSRHIPLDAASMDLFEKSSDGMIMCKLINLAQFDAIDERSINKKENMNVYQKTENQNLVLNAAKSIGCQVINIGAQDLIQGRPILILGLVWQIIKIQLLSQISLKNIPELVLLLHDGEEMADFLKLPPEMILLRWLNYHLKKANSTREVKNFGVDLSDSEVYSIVLNRLDPQLCPLIDDPSLLGKAAKVINNAKALGADVFLKPKDICDGNKKLNTAMVAQLFNTCHGLIMDEDDQGRLSEVDLSALEIDDAGDSREERVFRMWINSLNISGVYVNDLFAESTDGVNLLKVIERVSPGTVAAKRINEAPKSRFKKVENANYVVELGKKMQFSMVNVGGLDIVDGNKKIILAVMWQLMRKYTLQVLADLASTQNITDISEEHIVQWANAKVMSTGKPHRMRNLKDSGLSNSIFLLSLITAIEPRAVNWDCVVKGESEEEKIMNAKYAISNARKVGACVFLTPEDIVEVKSKMLLTFLSALWAAQIERENAASKGPSAESTA